MEQFDIYAPSLLIFFNMKKDNENRIENKEDYGFEWKRCNELQKSIRKSVRLGKKLLEERGLITVNH